jgi:hypothetical protein
MNNKNNNKRTSGKSINTCEEQKVNTTNEFNVSMSLADKDESDQFINEVIECLMPINSICEGDIVERSLMGNFEVSNNPSSFYDSFTHDIHSLAYSELVKECITQNREFEIDPLVEGLDDTLER